MFGGIATPLPKAILASNSNHGHKKKLQLGYDVWLPPHEEKLFESPLLTAKGRDTQHSNNVHM